MKKSQWATILDVGGVPGASARAAETKELLSLREGWKA